MTTRTRTLWTFAITSVGLFMVSLDNLVVTTAIPVIREDLGASIEDLEWTVNAYTLTFAVLLLTGAALGDRFGRRRLFALGLAIFTLASVGAALAPSVELLNVARAVQGLGGAIVMPLTLTLLSAAVSPERRGVALGFWGGIGGLAVAFGPVVGGAVVEGISWQWIFWLNVPIGILLVPLALTRLSESTGPAGQLDLRGVSLASAGLFGIVWGLVRGNAEGWASPEILTALSLGGVLVAAFVAWELRAPAPMLPMRFFSSAAFTLGNAASLLMFFGMFGSIFLLAQFFQTVQGYSPLGSGLRILPWTLAPMFIAPVAGALSDRIPPRLILGTGLSLQAAALAWIALVFGANALVVAQRISPAALPDPAGDALAAIAPWRTVNGYGLFAVMTTERPEILVEGTLDGTTWRAYEFRWKPGSLDRAPAFVAPHQPRLDWEMWFAALRGCRRSPWFPRFALRLLEGSERVLGLLASNPFPDAPPRAVRSSVHRYRFAAADLRRRSGRWWTREEPGAPFCPTLRGTP